MNTWLAFVLASNHGNEDAKDDPDRDEAQEKADRNLNRVVVCVLIVFCSVFVSGIAYSIFRGGFTW